MTPPPHTPSKPDPGHAAAPGATGTTGATGNGEACSDLGKRAMPPINSVLQANLSDVRAEITSAAKIHGRPEPALVAVTKFVSAATAMALHRLGSQDLAENRAPAFLEKVEAFRGEGLKPTWHFIGHLQRNKARRVLEEADVLHSVDSVRLAATIARILEELSRPVQLFLEVNLTGETEKHGLRADEWPEALDALAGCPFAKVAGLMVMGPLEGRGGKSTQEVFQEAGALAIRVEEIHGHQLEDGKCRLSMGMSGDLDPAIRWGSTHVRVGSSLFESL